LLWFWRVLFFREGSSPTAPHSDTEWQRGRYLAEAVAHCQECHTPRNFFGALEESKAYSGNPDGPDQQDAPNITPDKSSKIASWSVDDIAQLLTDGQTPDFDYVGSGMGDVVKGTGALSKADRHAIAVYQVAPADPYREAPEKEEISATLIRRVDDLEQRHDRQTSQRCRRRRRRYQGRIDAAVRRVRLGRRTG